MVKFEKKEILIDGKPVFLLSGELHYFRQPPENWQHLLDEAKEMGLNCISSYVPWLLHEEKEGEFCFEGRLDLGAFIDLCAENGLYFFVRPGPFIMAEMKGEGIPYWVAKKHPSAVPVGFDGKLSAGTNLDYLDPGYLEECRRWYQKVMPIIAPRLHCQGGNVIGVQLDNEIGMLNWVMNSPMLNENTLSKFTVWLKKEYPHEELSARYPFSLEDKEIYLSAFRSPKEEWVTAFHFDFGRFLRKYYAEYVAILKGYAEENGIHDTPFFINIHGTGNSRLMDYPLGVSQLYEAFNQGQGMISGTDVYLGEPTEGTYQDLYVANAITDCMNQRGNPLTSIEFECSDGPYCSLLGTRYHPSATSQKMLMCLSQNARMLSFYVFSGGENYLLRFPEHDGNERMAFTGQAHGVNAPVQPDGTRNYSFGHIRKTARTIHALNELIASSHQETDPVSLGFIPDYFLTELAYPASEKIRRVFDDLRRWRCAGAIDSVARGLLSNGISFDAVNLQKENPVKERLLVVLSARYMDAKVQEKLADFLEAGGRVFFYGELPEYDLEGEPCRILLEKLGLDSPEYVTAHHPVNYPTAECAGNFEGAAPAYTLEYAQAFSPDDTQILTLHGSGKMCGFLRNVGQGKACGVTADYPADMEFYRRVWEALGVVPSWKASHYRQGIYLSSTVSLDGQRLLYLMNLDAFPKTVDIVHNGEVLFPGFQLGEKASHILPIGVKAGEVEVLSSTAELVKASPEELRFLPTQNGSDIVKLKTQRIPCLDRGPAPEKKEDFWLLKLNPQEETVVRFSSQKPTEI